MMMMMHGMETATFLLSMWGYVVIGLAAGCILALLGARLEAWSTRPRRKAGIVAATEVIMVGTPDNNRWVGVATLMKDGMTLEGVHVRTLQTRSPHEAAHQIRRAMVRLGARRVMHAGPQLPPPTLRCMADTDHEGGGFYFRLSGANVEIFSSPTYVYESHDDAIAAAYDWADENMPHARVARMAVR